ncbi:AAA domain-containing protein, putative AbiEii toxin, Type IV TA system [Flavobacterium fontis]|uniref:AAA domain-containing protein, putative AbiEii toxin, Type IV TA system n=1 Tax=Flavobacterium fontis TaxID=1124188 RepID=A0A1M5EXP4_9FLAO|nr:AAA family ATPase [Flavobacterium fontis]SHF83906.1 AAA domain-containing protein, putative AbiEii toxin, Type IV TA system [Flavobacterium fontis]
MKLCYIWIDDYKGFKNQGFNLATEHTFEYSNSILKRTENKKHIKNFFGNGITDVIGIIGKNASGKTNLLELIQYISDGANTIINKPFFAVFNDGNYYTIYNYKMPYIKNEFGAEIKSYDGKIPSINSIFFSNVFDGRRHNFSKKIINISTNDLLNSSFGENINKNYQKTIQQQIKFIKSPQFKLLEDIETSVNSSPKQKLKPSKVILTSPIWSNIINRIKTFDERYKRETENEIRLKEFVLSFRKKITDNKSTNSIKYFSAFLVFIDFILNRDILNHVDGKVIKDKKELHRILNSLFEVTQSDYRIDEVFKYFIGDFATTIDKYWGIFETYKFLSELADRDLGNQSNSEFKEDIGTYANRRVQFTLEYNDRVGSFLTGYLDATTNQSLSYSVEWAGISSGHKAYINLFANFYSIAGKIKEDNVLICIDEGDLYFHPKWQTEFLFKLINILPKLLDKKCQIFLTTHSPFLVSDLPKSNLLFVRKNENENLEAIANTSIEGETFGGNIGELYLDAFFMQGSLISHFAASKIQVLVNKIRNQESQISNEDRILIAQIGDELIRGQLNKLLNDKN